MKTLKSMLTLSVLMAFASAGALADGVQTQDQTRDGQRGYARADDGKPAYYGIGEKTGVPLPGAAFSTEALDPADFPGAAEDEPGFGEWGPSEAGNAQPGLGAPWSGSRPR